MLINIAAKTPSMNPEFIKNISIIKEAIEQKKLVLFVGSGVSVDSEVPVWKTLVDEMKSEMDIAEKESDYLRIAEMYYNRRKEKEFLDKVRSVLKHKKVRFNPIHELLFELQPEHIITTNFEDLLEQVIKSKAHPFSVIKKDTEFPYASNTKLLVKMHGDLDEGNLVIKESDYLGYAETHPLIEGFLKGIFASRVVLFVGYGFSDLNLKAILQSVRKILGSNFQNTYFLSTESDFHSSLREYLRVNGLTVIHYDDAGTHEGVNWMELYLKGVNILDHNDSFEKPILSDKGLKLFTLLKFIENYAVFEEKIARENVLDQMYLSLSRFRELKSLPSAFLSNLFPFNKSSGHIYNYSKHILGSNNKTVRDFFFEYVDEDTLLIKPSFFEKEKISQAEQKEYEKKWKFILQTLNYSCIQSFGRTNHPIQPFHYPEQFYEIIELTRPEKICDCLNCRFNMLQIKSFLHQINQQSITETSDLQDDQLIAYGHYKAGNFKVAFENYETIANKAWQVGKYLTHYVAKQNQLYLKAFIGFQSDESTERSKQSMLRKIKKLDLNKIKYNGPIFGKQELQLIEQLGDSDILMEAERKINEYYKKLQNVDHLYKNSGFSSGPYYPVLIMHQLFQIFCLYNHNCLIRDDFGDFRKVMQTGINALLLCYRIDKRYGERLPELNAWILRFIIHYGDHDELLRMIRANNLKNITVPAKDQDLFLLYFTNLLESMYTENNFLGRTVSMDDTVSTQVSNFFFKDRMSGIFNRVFLLFGSIQLPDDPEKIPTKVFMDFLQAEDLIKPGHMKFFVICFQAMAKYFSLEQFNKILALTAEKGYYFTDETFYPTFASQYQDRFPLEKISNIKILNKIITKSQANPGNPYTNFAALWPICSEDIQVIIKNTLSCSLDECFRLEDFLEYCFTGIFSFGERVDAAINKLEQSIPSSFRLEYNAYRPQSWNFANFVNCLYYFELVDHVYHYPKFASYPLYWQFYLRPLTFDYAQFDPQWLMMLHRPHIHTALATIDGVKTKLQDAVKKKTNKQLNQLFIDYYL